MWYGFELGVIAYDEYTSLWWCRVVWIRVEMKAYNWYTAHYATFDQNVGHGSVLQLLLLMV